MKTMAAPLRAFCRATPELLVAGNFCGNQAKHFYRKHHASRREAMIMGWQRHCLSVRIIGRVEIVSLPNGNAE